MLLCVTLIILIVTVFISFAFLYRSDCRCDYLEWFIMACVCVHPPLRLDISSFILFFFLFVPTE